MTGVVLAVLLGTAAMVALLAVVFTLSATRRSEPGLGARPPAPRAAAVPNGGVAPPPRPGAVDGSWNAMILGGGVIGAMGGTLNATFGRFDLVGGSLSFTRDGASGADWTAPCGHLRVHQLGLVVAKGDVELNGPMGQVRATVSRERVNRITRNSFKDVREQGYAREFVHVLLLNGAFHG
ncbi:hypothetical protein [Aeromicrobium alkaliterrae]|uniref:Uncharacterized protein n=1 Tax=Aeromicrobium alkaliterrae TaxID=302168 RepID=A0ABN2JVU0_9ACTN